MTSAADQEERLRAAHAALMDSGKVLEAGWIGLVLACRLAGAPEIQLKEMRMAFFAGAQHLFATIIHALDPGEEPTEDDMRRLDLVDAELQAFIAEFAAQHMPGEGGIQ